MTHFEKQGLSATTNNTKKVAQKKLSSIELKISSRMAIVLSTHLETSICRICSEINLPHVQSYHKLK
jgi:RNase P subunit RPR2